MVLTIGHSTRPLDEFIDLLLKSDETFFLEYGIGCSRIAVRRNSPSYRRHNDIILWVHSHSICCHDAIVDRRMDNFLLEFFKLFGLHAFLLSLFPLLHSFLAATVESKVPPVPAGSTRARERLVPVIGARVASRDAGKLLSHSLSGSAGLSISRTFCSVKKKVRDSARESSSMNSREPAVASSMYTFSVSESLKDKKIRTP